MKILMIDDSFINRKLNKSQLKGLTFDELVETDNGKTALEIIDRRAKGNSFDLVLTDISMPTMNGIEFIRQFTARTDLGFIPVIVITDHLEDSFLEEAFDAGAVDYLIRPVRKFELHARIRSAYRLKKETEETNKVIHELESAIENVKTLNRLMPICSSCKRIRDDQGYWNQVETYIAGRSFAEFTHGFCPDCIESLYGAFLRKI